MIPERIIWHHTAHESAGPQFDLVNEWHGARGFPLSSMGYLVGYHYLIEADGTVRKARAETEIGAHDKDENANSIGICLAGSFQDHGPNDAQIEAIVKLTHDIVNRWGIKINRIEPHRWDDNTDCPGLWFPDNWLITEYLLRQGNEDLKQFILIADKYSLL
jgi:hypothetical protein